MNAAWMDATAASGELTRETLTRALAAASKRGVEPRHDCRLDGHVMVVHPNRDAWCMYCGERS
jgi:hypothetical protein